MNLPLRQQKKDLRPKPGTKVFLQTLRGTTQIAPAGAGHLFHRQ